MSYKLRKGNFAIFYLCNAVAAFSDPEKSKEPDCGAVAGPDGRAVVHEAA